MSGAHPIIAVDLVESKLTTALTFGATHTVDGALPDVVVEKTKQLTSGRGADWVFVTVGSSEAVAQGLDLIRRQGTVVIVRIPGREATVALPVAYHVVQERRITGSKMGSSRPSVDIPRLVQLYQMGRLKLDELIAARYHLEDINEAIQLTEAGGALRNVIVFP